MAVSKSRLGRGLNSLIAGGIGTATPAPVKPPKASPAPEKTKPKKKSSKKKKTPKSAETKPSTPSKEAPPSPPVASAPQPKAPRKVPTKKSSAPAPEALEGTTPFPAKSTESEAAAHQTAAPLKEGLAEISIAKVDPNPHQPRKSFDDESLRELAESIRSEGLLQPIVVRLVGERYQLIAGERRWRACQQLKLKKVPARIVDASEASSAVMSLIENLQRENLNPIEEALGYASLISDFELTQEAVSERVGKSRAGVANSLRLLQLDSEVRGFLSRGLLSVGHAKVLLGLESPDDRVLLARQIIERGLSVRETEKAVLNRRKGGSLTGSGAAHQRTLPPAEAAAIADLERRLASNLSTRVQLKHTPKKGKLVIEYYGNDDLQRLLERIGMA
jgi:ParB family chromosome partitioning protein